MTNRKLRLAPGITLVLLTAILLAACGDATNTTAPATVAATTRAATTAATTTVAAATTASATTAAVTTVAATTAVATTAVPTTSAVTTTAAATAAAAPTKKLNVVTSVAPINNIALNVGGNRVNLTQLIPDGTDSHTFEPAAGDARILNEADLIIVNGIGLETPTLKLADSTKKKDTPILKLADNTITEKEWVFDFSFPKDKGDPNPHLWMNPDYAKKYAQLINDQLAKQDPAGKDYYAANLKAYLNQLNEMDKAMAIALATVPEKNRKLVTYHDSFAYWANHFKWSVIGAIQPADFKEPSAKEVADIIEQLKKEQIPAIFGSEVFPSKVLEQIAKEANVKFYDTLRDDDLPGKPEAPEHSYVGMQLENTVTMIAALGGKADNLKGFNAANTYGK